MVNEISFIAQSYEHLRHVRGNDDAVVETGTPQALERLTSILKDPGKYSREDFLNAIFANFSGKAYGDNQWTRKISAWGEQPEVVTPYGKLREEYPELDPLSLDPGFISHIEEILKLLRSGAISVHEHSQVREELKEKLGCQTVYRGISLTDQELDAIKEQGLLSQLAKFVQSSDDPLREFSTKGLSAWMSYVVENHYHNSNYFTPLISVSAHPDVAVAVGRNFAKRDSEHKFYLLKLNIPKLDLITYSDYGVKMPYQLQEFFRRNPDFSVRVSVNGNESTYRFDHETESFIYWKIDPDDIVEITQPQVAESAWNNRKIIG